MFEKQSLQQMPKIAIPNVSDFSHEETDLNVFGISKQVSKVFDPLSKYSEIEVLWLSDKHEILTQIVDPGSLSLVSVLKNLIDVVLKSELEHFTSLTESHYQELVDALDVMIDVIGENENHILAPLMDFIGNLIECYEDKHIPELSAL